MYNPNKPGGEDGPSSNYDQWKELEEQQREWVVREHGGGGLVPSEQPIRGTMSHEEFVNWQGENGEIYRGMVPSKEPDLRGTMSHEEFVNWQGENGEIYRGLKPMDAVQAAAWRKESFGTTDVDLAEISKQARVFNYSDKESVSNVLDSLVEEPDTVQSVVEHRIKDAFAKMDWRNLSPEHTFTDLLFIEGAMQRGMDLGNTEINGSFLVGGKEMMPVSKALEKLSEYYGQTGLKIANPDNPDETIKASDYANRIMDEIKERAQNAE